MCFYDFYKRLKAFSVIFSEPVFERAVYIQHTINDPAWMDRYHYFWIAGWVAGYVPRELMHVRYDLRFILHNRRPAYTLADIDTDAGEKQLKQTEAIIYSMTPAERSNPKLLNPRRKYRIAKGAGVDIAVVNRFIKQFEQSQKMMKQMPGMMKGFGKRGMRFPF